MQSHPHSPNPLPPSTVVVTRRQLSSVLDPSQNPYHVYWWMNEPMKNSSFLWWFGDRIKKGRKENQNKNKSRAMKKSRTIKIINIAEEDYLSNQNRNYDRWCKELRMQERDWEREGDCNFQNTAATSKCSFLFFFPLTFPSFGFRATPLCTMAPVYYTEYYTQYIYIYIRYYLCHTTRCNGKNINFWNKYII